jgi:hypothetical protein
MPILADGASKSSLECVFDYLQPVDAQRTIERGGHSISMAAARSGQRALPTGAEVVGRAACPQAAAGSTGNG